MKLWEALSWLQQFIISYPICTVDSLQESPITRLWKYRCLPKHKTNGCRDGPWSCYRLTFQ